MRVEVQIKPKIAVTAQSGLHIDADPALQDKSVSFTPTEQVQAETVTADVGYDGLREVSVEVGAVPADYVGSEITRRSQEDMSVDGAVVTAPAGYYAEAGEKTVPSGSLGNYSSESYVRNGSYYDITKTFPGMTPGYFASMPPILVRLLLQNNTVTPSEAEQVVMPNTTNSYLNKVKVEGISPTYVGSGVTRRDSGDLSASGNIVTVPAGYYEEAAQKAVDVPWVWIGKDVEKLANCYNETTSLSAVGFDSWTASNTASTLRNGQTGTAIAADMANYDYLIRWRCFWEAAYNAGATMTAIPYDAVTEIYQMVCRRPSNLANVQSETYDQNVSQSFFNMSYQEYWNTSGNHVANWGNTYGITFTNNAPTYGGGDTPTVTPICPSIGARCNNSYFNTARKGDIDSANSKVRIVGEVYRMKKSALRSVYESIVEIANNGL